MRPYFDSYTYSISVQFIETEAPFVSQRATHTTTLEKQGALCHSNPGWAIDPDTAIPIQSLICRRLKMDSFSYLQIRRQSTPAFPRSPWWGHRPHELHWVHTILQIAAGIKDLKLPSQDGCSSLTERFQTVFWRHDACKKLAGYHWFMAAKVHEATKSFESKISKAVWMATWPRQAEAL